MSQQCQVDLAAQKPTAERARKSKPLISWAEQNAFCLLSALLSGLGNKVVKEGSQVTLCAIRETRWASLLPLCAPPSSHPGPGEPPVVVCHWNKLAGSSCLDISNTYMAIFTSVTLPNRCVSPHSKTGLAVPSCRWLNLGLVWTVSCSQYCLHWRILNKLEYLQGIFLFVEWNVSGIEINTRIDDCTLHMFGYLF